MTPLLRIENLSVDFISEEGKTSAVKDVSITINKGELLALVGESGSGKSVTAMSILGLLPRPPAHYPNGQINFTEGDRTKNLLTLPFSDLQTIRGNKIGMIFHEPMSSLNPVMMCGKQVMEALLVHKKVSEREAKAQTIEWFRKVKLPQPAQMFKRYPHQLSGGQKQRVMIAMAICCRPQLLICDEPTTALDVTVQKAILHLVKELQQELDMGVLFITHDLGVVAEIADRVAIMYKGEVVETDTAKAIFSMPVHPYTKALIACRPSLHPKGEPLPTIGQYLDNGKGNNIATGAHLPKKETELLMQIEHLSVLFPNKTSLFGKPTSFVKAIDNISFEIFKNETLGLVGESGCGKTTVGRTLLRLVEPTSGKIFYKGSELAHPSKARLKELRKEVQLIFQDPYSSLNPRLTIGAAIAEPMKVSGLTASAKDRKKKVIELLEKVSLPQNVMNRYPHQFSGGQRQRIVIARALGLNPDFLVCDESVSALDVSVQAQVLNLLNNLKKQLNLTMLFISHDLSVVRYMCDRIIIMQAGKIVESGMAEEVYRHPKSSYTKTLINAVPRVSV